MKATTIIVAILGVFVVTPIWFYLIYKILQAVNASELMWFLFWIYLPAHILVAVLQKLLEVKKTS